MLVMPPASSSAVVGDGIYEITDSVSGQYLNSIAADIYNRYCDDALILQDKPSRLGKWEIASIGHGYTVKQVSSGLYCALADCDQLLSQTVVLSPVPTVWCITYEDLATQTVRITWSISDLCWDTPPSGQGRLVSMGKLAGVKDGSDKSAAMHMTWCLKPTGPNDTTGQIQPGIYALQNKASQTYVSLSPDESTVSCWPEAQLEKTGVRLWEIQPLGGGYTIRLVGTDRYCTLQSGIGYKTKVTMSRVPAAWRIVASKSPILADEGLVQIFWADTQVCWDLASFGRATPGNPVEVIENKGYQPCRLFKLSS